MSIIFTFFILFPFKTNVQLINFFPDLPTQKQDQQQQKQNKTTKSSGHT